MRHLGIGVTLLSIGSPEMSLRLMTSRVTLFLIARSQSAISVPMSLWQWSICTHV